MRFFSILIICFFVASCTSNKKAGTSTVIKDEVQANPKTKGKISHQYRATGCSTVVIVDASVLDAPLVLIPKDKLPSGLDINGLEISFNYRTLKMPNPPGCNTGIPAEIKDITNVKK
ncbi:MAG: hypothetical protein ACT4ON_13000 [Bacteroidota bacterium]